MTDAYDVVVIGAGPAGYVAAIRCAQLGLTTACVDDFIGKDGKPALGGTCLNVGCIPSKALLDSSKHFHQLNHGFAAHGIKTNDVSIDIDTMIGRKDKIVQQLTSGIKQLFKANSVTPYSGWGKLLSDHRVEVLQTDGTSIELQANHVILATGSVPIELPSMAFDGEYIIDNAGALDLDKVPESLGVIGAGVIGLELGSVWRRLGSEVVLLEALPEFLSAADKDIARASLKEFKRLGLDIRLGAMVNSASVRDGEVHVTYTQDEKDHEVVFDKLLVAVGRRANTSDLLGENTGVTLNQRGQIEVDERCHTGAENIWAVGDAVRGPMLAHKGSEEGIAVAETIAGQSPHLDLATVPWVVYTEPEIAWVGQTESELQNAGIQYNKGTFPFAATGRALAMAEPAGLVKILADVETDRVLGVHIVGANASELIAEAVVIMEFHGSSEDLARIVHAHPTMSEAVHEAALSVDKRAIHKVN